ALSYIPAHHYETWVRMGMALKSELGDAGLDLWLEWSESDESYNERQARKKWNSFEANGKVGIGTVIYEAQRHGWKTNGHDKLKPSSEKELAERERRSRKAEAKEAAKHARAAAKGAAIWNAATPANDDHTYLKRKGNEAHGLRIYRGDLKIAGMRCDGALIVTLCNAGGELKTLQFISPDGDKKYLPDGEKSGCYYLIGGEPGSELCIAEGFATAATIFEATGISVAAAMDVGNLKAVALALREKYPNAQLILCADDDVDRTGNPGLTRSREAAVAVNGLLAVPDCRRVRPQGAKDFNDVVQVFGAEAVRSAIANAKPASRAEAEAAREMPSADANDSRIVYRRLSDIEAKPVRWLWPGRIARGKVTLLAGNPGLGKSQVTASMAAIVSTGGKWPVDRSQCQAGNVIILSAEDDAADTLKPRLIAAGADLNRVFIADSIVTTQADSYEAHRAFSLKADLERLGKMLSEIQNVALIIIDPISAYLGDTESHKNADVRSLLAPLAELAARHGSAVVCVSHLNKGGNSEAMMRVTGSLAFVAAARAAFLIARDRENAERRLFLPIKNNIGKDGTGLAFTLRSVAVSTPAGTNETSCVGWENEAVTITADEAMTPPEDAAESSAQTEAVEWLMDTLKDRIAGIDG
ncbi:MAG: AAA family ATPase, partial [Burkholderiales bacterium]